jgi:hypothetical protein
MAIPELIANSATPGTVVALTTLATEATAEATTIKTNAAAPVALQAAGQFRIVLGSEIMIVTAGATTTTWTVTRKAEGSAAAIHAVGTSVFHFLTAEALEALIGESGLVGTTGLVNLAVTEGKVAAAVQNKLNPTAWAVMASLSAKVEEIAAQQTLGARNEDGATMTRLRGGLKVKAGEELKAGETICTLPEGRRPLKLVKVMGVMSSNFSVLSIATTGVVTASTNWGATTECSLDGITFNLT